MIRLSNLKKTFQGPNGPVEAIKGINIHVEQGEIFGIVGLSGAGKSTLVRCINMLERPTSGTVVVDGKDLTSMSESQLREVRKSIAMIFQHFNLLSSATVYDNVAFPLRLSNTPEEKIRGKVIPLLELVGLSDKADNYPAQLSGGQKQRVGIARALANDPKVLLCDEATSALDPQTTKAILALIKDINKKMGLTVVVITHEMSVITDICDRVAVISEGVVAESGRVLDIFTNPQCEITKEFTSVILSRELPGALKNKELSQKPVNGAQLLIWLTFIGNSTDEPVLSTMIRKYDADVSILYGMVGEIQSTSFGRMLIGITGDTTIVKSLLEYLKDRQLMVEVVGYVK